MFKRIKIVFLFVGVFLIFMTNITYAGNPDSVVKYTISEDEKIVIPRLIRVEEVSENCFKITYSEKVELKKALDPNNYWIQNLKEKEANDGICSLGKREKVCKENSLSKDKVTIINEGSTGKVFLLKFKDNIPENSKYKVIIYSVTISGGKPYNGSNGMLNIVTK